MFSLLPLFSKTWEGMSVGVFRDDRAFASILDYRVCYLRGLREHPRLPGMLFAGTFPLPLPNAIIADKEKPLVRRLKNIGMASKKNCIETLKCNRCNLQYIGETKRLLLGRFNERRRPVNKTNVKSKPTTVSEPFLSLSVYSHTDMQRIPLEKVHFSRDSVRNCNLHSFSILFLSCTSFPPLPFKRVLVRHSPSISW